MLAGRRVQRTASARALSRAGVVALLAVFVTATAAAQDARLVPFPPSPVATISDGSSSTLSTEFAPSGSSWATAVPESSVFQARLTHRQRGVMGDVIRARGFDIRIGRAGQIFSWRGAFGESVAPQFRAMMPPAHPDPDFAPWVDEVWQSIAVNTMLNRDAPYFIHQAGVYRTDPVLRGSFYSPTLAAGPGAPSSSYVVVSWGQHAHIPTRWRSGLVNYTQYRDVGAGILEVTLVGYNAGADLLNRWNAPWGGVRGSSLPVEELSIGGRLVTIAPGIEWDSPADVRDATDGYGLFRTDAGDAALALVFGPDREASLAPAQWRNATIRTGTALPDERDLRAFSVVRPLDVQPGEAFWARWYFVVGSRTAVLSVIDAYELVDRAEYGILRIAPEDSALLGYDLDASGAAIAAADPAAARLVLWALPVAGSIPLYRLVRPRGAGEVLSPSPYALSDPPYDDATARWDLLGYAFEADHEPSSPDGYEPVAIEAVLGASPYRAAGYALRVLRPVLDVPDAGIDAGEDSDGGATDASATDLDGGPDTDANDGRGDGGAVAALDAPGSQDAARTLDAAGAPSAGAGCGCRAAPASSPSWPVWIVAALLLDRRRRRR